MKILNHIVIWIITALLATTHLVANQLSFLSLDAPDGIKTTVTFPAGMPSYFGDGIISADREVYSLKLHNSRFSVSSIESYQQDVRFFAKDIDGDNYQDIIVALTQAPTLRLLIGGENGLSASEDVDIGGNPALSVGVARMDKDTLLDLIVVDSTSIRIFRRVLPDSGSTIQFSQFLDDIPLESPSPGHPLISENILAGDFDGNKLPDLVLNGFVYLNQSNGNLVPRQLPVPPGVDITLLDFVYDIDGDGKHELLWLSYQEAEQQMVLTVADYEANEIFRPTTNLPTGLTSVNNVFRYDIDEDGYYEIGLYSATDGRAIEFPGSDSGFVVNNMQTLFESAAVGQFIGPVGPGAKGKFIWMFHSPAEGILHAGYPSDAMPSYSDAAIDVGIDDVLAGQAVAVGDYNSDNLPDIYIVNNGGSNALYRGEHDGRFTEVAEQAGIAVGNDGISCAWGDYNNDGHQDLIVTGLSLPDKLFFNNGDGTFSDSSHILDYNRGSQRATSVSWGDTNGDGWLDLLITNFDGANWLLINHEGRYFDNTSGGFGSTDSFNNTENASMLDINLDGFLDIILLNDEGPVRLILGEPGGQWDDVTASSGLNPGSTYYGFGQSQSWGDFNGDGFPDLFITRAADNNSMFLNNGSEADEQFQLVYSGRPSGGVGGIYGRLASVIEDLDADGYTDLLITRTSRFGTNSEIPLDEVYLGDSRGYPPISTDESTDTPSPGDALVDPLRIDQETSLPVAGDFDRDGDIDMLYINYLPDDPQDFFHGGKLPLLYMRNNAAWANTMTVILQHTDMVNLIGTSVGLAHNGRIYWKAVSGGGGRIQTGPFLTFTLGSAAEADSVVIRWSDGVIRTLYPPFDSDGDGTIEIGPQLPGDLNSDGKVSTEDMLRLLAILKGDSPPATASEITAGDLNSNGKLEIFDLLALLELL